MHVFEMGSREKVGDLSTLRTVPMGSVQYPCSSGTLSTAFLPSSRFFRNNYSVVTVQRLYGRQFNVARDRNTILQWVELQENTKGWIIVLLPIDPLRRHISNNDLCEGSRFLS